NRRRSDLHEAEQSRRSRADRRPVRGSSRRRGNRPDRAQYLLLASRRPRLVRNDPGSLDRGPLSRALSDLPLRPRSGSGYLIGSADLMQRNLDRRVEVLAPVMDPMLQRRLDEIVDLLEADDALAWELDSDGNWRRVSEAGTVDAQEQLQQA